MSAREKLMALAGAHMAESIEVDRGPAPPAPAAAAAKHQGVVRLRGAMEVPLAMLCSDPGQPRKEFDPDSLARLADSLRARGQLMPARVRWSDALGKWVVIAGDRRFRAAAIAGLATLQCVEAPNPLTPHEVLAEQLTENALREDLKPAEEARAYQQLMNHHGWTQTELAGYLNVSQSRVSKSLALLRLPGDVLEDVDAGAIPASTASAIARERDPGARSLLIDRARARRAGEPGPDVAAGKPATRVSIRVEGGEVRVRLDRPGAGPDLVLKALRDALRSHQSAHRGVA